MDESHQRGKLPGTKAKFARGLRAILILSHGLWLCCPSVLPAAPWQSALARMPLQTNPAELNQTNVAAVLLGAFQSNQVVKALILMPGTTDEFYFFKRAKVTLTTNSLTLLDAVQALTNQTLIRATFRPPFLLLHTDEDPLEPLATVKHSDAAEQLRQRQFVPHAVYFDKDWDYLLPILTRTLDAGFRPRNKSPDSWHFYRHTLAAWNLNGWEALEAISLAGKTTFVVERTFLRRRPKVVFEGDLRVRNAPVFR